MNRYQTYGRLDTQLAFEGDPVFTGLDLKHDRGILSPGLLARSENKRLRRGSADTRGGTNAPESCNFPQFSTGFNGATVYSNPNKDEELVLSPRLGALPAGSDPYVWAVKPDTGPLSQIKAVGMDVSMPDEPIIFCQAFDKLILLQADRGPNLIWDGINTAGFQEITKLDPADDTTALVPPSIYAQYFENRILYVQTFRSDEVIMSDVNDPSSYDKVYGKIRINAGHTDAIRALVPYTRNTVLVFQEHSLHALNNLTLDLSLTSQEQLNPEIGIVGPYAWAHVGGDVMFLSYPHGVYRFGDVVLQNTRVPPVPVSDPIQPIIDRVNWASPFIKWCSAVVDGEYLIFMVPLDGQTYPSTALIYNVVTGGWESIDTWTDSQFQVDRLLICNFLGTRRRFGVNNQYGRVYLFDEDKTDVTGIGRENTILDTIETRAYGAQLGDGPGGIKTFRRLTVGLKTNNPSVTFTAMGDGAFEEKLLTPAPITKDRTKFYTWGHADFDPVTGDPKEPKRLDYSEASLGWAGQDFEALPADIYFTLPGDTIEKHDSEISTESLERRMIRLVGRTCSIRIANTQGRCNVLGVGVDGLTTKNYVRVAA